MPALDLTLPTPEFMQRPSGTSWYRDDQKDAALLYIATQCVTVKQAAIDLGVAQETVHGWARRHAARLQELRVKYGPDLEERAVTGLQSFVVAAEEVKRAALAKTLEQIEDGSIKDPARALQSVAVAQGIAVQKILELTGRPTSVIHHQSMNEIVARLRALGAEVEGSAEPMVDSDVIAEPHASPPVGELTQEAEAHGHRNDHEAQPER